LGGEVAKLLNIHILNVGHGDSIVLEFISHSGRAFGVIDSNTYTNNPPRALAKLKELDAEQISFLCITHPHWDHYRGIYSIMREYRGRIGEFYTFPLGHLRPEYIKKLAKKFLLLRDM
jgi:metal-dependent hydrolase (beta-lactamase superfamily II)